MRFRTYLRSLLQSRFHSRIHLRWLLPFLLVLLVITYQNCAQDDFQVPGSKSSSSSSGNYTVNFYKTDGVTPLTSFDPSVGVVQVKATVIPMGSYMYQWRFTCDTTVTNSAATPSDTATANCTGSQLKILLTIDTGKGNISFPEKSIAAVVGPTPTPSGSPTPTPTPSGSPTPTPTPSSSGVRAVVMTTDTAGNITGGAYDTLSTTVLPTVAVTAYSFVCSYSNYPVGDLVINQLGDSATRTALANQYSGAVSIDGSRNVGFAQNMRDFLNIKGIRCVANDYILKFDAKGSGNISHVTQVVNSSNDGFNFNFLGQYVAGYGWGAWSSCVANIKTRNPVANAWKDTGPDVVAPDPMQACCLHKNCFAPDIWDTTTCSCM